MRGLTRRAAVLFAGSALFAPLLLSQCRAVHLEITDSLRPRGLYQRISLLRCRSGRRQSWPEWNHLFCFGWGRNRASYGARIFTDQWHSRLYAA